MFTQDESVTRIQELTRRYARYSRSHSGLGAVWGGCCMTLFGVLTFLSYHHDYLIHLEAGGRLGFWRFLVKQPSGAKGIFMLIGLLIPVIWLFGRTWIQKFVYDRHGVVIPTPTEEEAGQLKLLRVLEYFVPLACITLLWIRYFFRLSMQMSLTGDLPALFAASGLLLLLIPLCKRMASALDRTMALLVFIAGAFLIAGGNAESTLVLILVYSLLGLFQLSQGVKTHLQFRAVCKELDAVKKVEV